VTLERVRFSTAEPAKLAEELDRFVLAVDRELAALAVRSAQRFALLTPVSGRAGVPRVEARVGFWQLLPVSSASGEIAVYLPQATRADAGKGLLISVVTVGDGCEVHASGGATINMVSSSAVLPSAGAGAYLFTWDGDRWWYFQAGGV
jgi:hypothetical protein